MKYPNAIEPGGDKLAWGVIVPDLPGCFSAADSGIDEAIENTKEAIELLTEAGVDRIVPWLATRSIGKTSEKFQITAREASKQSRRYRIPTVSGAVTTADVVDEIAKADLALVLHEGAVKKISELVKPGAKKILIIIGPEGGLTDEEVESFAAAGAQVALMGRPILRSAHAGLAALSAVNACLQVW
jgi:16S rRNA (uracil1498-N3)-methyltransferase